MADVNPTQPQIPDTAKTLHGLTEISLRLRHLEDLFVAFDPSPLVDRDIDNAIESYVVEQALDAPSGRPLRLTITLPADADGPEDPAIADAFRNYFSFMRDREQQRIRRLWRDGRHTLLIGLVFLAGCIGLGQAARAVAPGAIGAFIAESLIILGWVANWKPIEIFLYDWRPMRKLRDVYDALTRMTVVVKRRNAF